MDLGKLITGVEFRDAIHIAVAPVTASIYLEPGQHIGFLSDGRVGVIDQPIGIVDPYLKSTVTPGERFWMFLYPNTITALRHEWTHPAFLEPETVPVKPSLADEKAASEAWLRDFAANNDCPDYDTLIAGASVVGVIDFPDDPEEYPGYYNVRLDDEYLHFGGYDAHGDIPPEFWGHVENVTGKKITTRPTYFSCSC